MEMNVHFVLLIKIKTGFPIKGVRSFVRSKQKWDIHLCAVNFHDHNEK